MKRPVPMAPPSPIITSCALPRLRRRPLSRSLGLSVLSLRIRPSVGYDARPHRRRVSVVVGDARIVAGADDPDDEHALVRGRLEGMQLLARQEDDIARLHRCLVLL